MHTRTHTQRERERENRAAKSQNEIIKQIGGSDYSATPLEEMFPSRDGRCWSFPRETAHVMDPISDPGAI